MIGVAATYGLAIEMPSRLQPHVSSIRWRIIQQARICGRDYRGPFPDVGQPVLPTIVRYVSTQQVQSWVSALSVCLGRSKPSRTNGETVERITHTQNVSHSVSSGFWNRNSWSPESVRRVSITRSNSGINCSTVEASCTLESIAAITGQSVAVDFWTST